MSTATDEAPAILIPSLPRQYHPVLAVVSKPIRCPLSSPEFFAVRSPPNCSELLFYLRIVEFDKPLWFMVHRRPNPNAATGDIKVARLPSSPEEPLVWSDYAVVGSKIYDLGHLFSTEVWIFHCGLHRWERDPSIPMRRHAV